MGFPTVNILGRAHRKLTLLLVYKRKLSRFTRHQKPTGHFDLAAKRGGLRWTSGFTKDKAISIVYLGVFCFWECRERGS